MAALKYQQVPHNKNEFLTKAGARKGFTEAYQGLELEYTVANKTLKARARAGITQAADAEKMGTPKSAIS